MPRSSKEPSFFIPAGAKLTVIFCGKTFLPLFLMAERTLSFDSLTAVSGRPTMSKDVGRC